MRKIIVLICLVAISLGLANTSFGQVDPAIVNWYNKKGAGMSTEKAYKKLKKRKTKTVIVAVIDSGVDVEHKDLQGKIWVNTKEIPKNGIDDDKNGYIDDINGWNFLGNSKGENVNQATLEKTRLLRTYSKKFEGIDPATLSSNEKEEYKVYQKIKTEVEEEIANFKNYKSQMDMLPAIMEKVPAIISSKLGKLDYTLKDLMNWNPTDEQDIQLKGLAMAMKNGSLSLADINEQLHYINDQLEYNLNVNFNERELIGDNPTDFSDIKYGNNDVEGADALHGTHVGGIIGAIRGNDLGGDGVAEDVKLMVLRAVPNGDENDKDVALAIRYAVDNGARIINMSFGKDYSVYQKEVYEAMKYADSKGVLLVHAAGNDNKNVDIEPNFPTWKYSFQTERLDLLLTIGASTRFRSKLLAADFSNYGVQAVDVFAPGDDIYNSVPNDKYKKLQGTSMAAPMVAGVAAFLASYFPSLSMHEIKDAILKSATSYKGTKQTKPGSEELVDFATLSVTGGVVNLYNAVKFCLELEKSKATK